MTGREYFMDRVVHKSHTHEDAASWDIQQQLAMTPVERLRAARTLKDRAFPADAKDVHACHATD